MSKPARLLSVDTSGAVASLALLEDGAVIEELPLHSPDGFAHLLFGQLGALLARHAWTVDSIGCVAGCAGPGSFTGVRVGLSAVKGLADALDRPAVAVSSLRAVASFGRTDLRRSAVLDARRGEVYAGLYSAEGALDGDEQVLPLARWVGSLGTAEPLEWVTPGPSLLAGLLPVGACVTRCPVTLAAAVARIGWKEWQAGRAGDALLLDANYVRRSDAELFWKDPVARRPESA